jgi:large subunit ribosomal protein L28
VTPVGQPDPAPAAQCDRDDLLQRLVQQTIKCMLTGAGSGIGNRVSHSHRRTRRRFDVSVQTKRYRLLSENRTVTLVPSARGIKTVDKIGVEAVVRRIRARGEKV